MTNVISSKGHHHQQDEHAGSQVFQQKSAVYTVMEIAALLRLSRSLTYQMVRTGQIPARQIGNRWVIPIAAFHHWLNSCSPSADEKE